MNVRFKLGATADALAIAVIPLAAFNEELRNLLVIAAVLAIVASIAIFKQSAATRTGKSILIGVISAATCTAILSGIIAEKTLESTVAESQRRTADLMESATETGPAAPDPAAFVVDPTDSLPRCATIAGSATSEPIDCEVWIAYKDVGDEEWYYAKPVQTSLHHWSAQVTLGEAGSGHQIYSFYAFLLDGDTAKFMQSINPRSAGGDTGYYFGLGFPPGAQHKSNQDLTVDSDGSGNARP